MKPWLLLAIFIAAMMLKRRLVPDPLVEVDRAADAFGGKWTIVGPFGPGEMPIDLQTQWEELKRTGIGPGHPDF